ncbi:hypothetical protein V5O48_016808, partial [Marasmius crinis-equi]
SWRYNPHDNDFVGDQLSLALDKRGTILPAVVRPYPTRVAGILLRREWEVTEGRGVAFNWSEPEIDGKAKASTSVEKSPLSLAGVKLKARETEIFFSYLLTSGRQIYLSGLGPEDRWVHDEERQTLFVIVSDQNRKPGKRHRIEVSIAPNPYPPHQLFFIVIFETIERDGGGCGVDDFFVGGDCCGNDL